VIRYHTSERALVTCCLNRNMSNLRGLGLISDINCDNLNVCISKMQTRMPIKYRMSVESISILVGR
jgi:hypothetical protein